MVILILVGVLWYSSLFFQSFFLHRYAAHQTYTMSKTTEKITFILTWLCQGPSYLSAYGYGIMHRMHHAYTDTEKDPHSPSYDHSLFAMMWKTKNIPQWKRFDSFAGSRGSRIFWIVIYTVLFAFLTTAWWQWLLLPILFAMAPIHGVIINWFGHIYGYINFKTTDTSKNLFRFDFLMMGEGYHNNHHKHSNRANFGGVHWYEIDVTYLIMRILDKIGVIQLKMSALKA